MIAIIPGIITIVLASVGLSQASRSNSPKGVIVAGLVIGVIAVMISFSQIFVAGRIASKADNWPSDIQKAIEEVRDDVIRDMEDSKVSIKIESSDGDTVDINIRTKGNDVRVKQLEDLEEGKPEPNDTAKKGK